jgi:hypothetical protein
MSIATLILSLPYPETKLGNEILRGRIADIADEHLKKIEERWEGIHKRKIIEQELIFNAERDKLLEKHTQMLASLATLIALGRLDNDGCVECEDLDNFIKKYE